MAMTSSPSRSNFASQPVKSLPVSLVFRYSNAISVISFILSSIEDSLLSSFEGSSSFFTQRLFFLKLFSL
jgi:hypothetical protein